MKAPRFILPLLLLANTFAYSEKTDTGRDLILAQDCERIVFASRGQVQDGHWYANIGYYSYDKESKLYSEGGHLCILNLKSGKIDILVADAKGTIRDPAVHYDGEKILFSYRKGDSENFHLYEINTDGSHLKQLTSGPFDDYEASYQPDGSLVFVSTRAKRWVNCWSTQVGTIHRGDGNGDHIQQLSPNLEHDNTPWVLPDGRVMYQRWEYIDRSQMDFHHLWTMNPDGTEQKIYYGNKHPGGLLIDAKPVPDSDEVILIDSPGHGRKEHSGKVTLLSNQNGPDDPKSKIHLTEDGYRDPYALSHSVFIAARGREIVAITRDGAEHPAFHLPETMFSKNLNIHEPRPIIKHSRERLLPKRTDESKATGTMLLSNVYIGQKMETVKKGTIKKLLVMEALPKPINYTGGMDPLTYGGSFTLERLLGTVPVEKDGSAFFEVPANRAVFFIALDKNEDSVKRMHSFTSVMPGEMLSCIGCHEDRTTVSPPTKTLPLAAKRSPSVIRKIEGIPDVFDFPRDIQPILDKHCVQCHKPSKRDGKILLTGDRGPMFSHSYYTLTVHGQFADGRNRPHANYDPYVIGAASSPLMKKLNGEHYGAQLSANEVKKIRYWIESAAVYPGTYAALGTGSIGGYQANKLVNNDSQWPTSVKGAEVIKRRCASCHAEKFRLPHNMSDERNISFWRMDINDRMLHTARHIVYNLSHPEQSLLLLGPLSKAAGGEGACISTAKDGSQKPVEIFKDNNDPDYQAILAMIRAGKDKLDEVTRFDMPNFKPRPEYIREMKRFGVLPKSFDLTKENVDPYQLDQRYWESLWYIPKK
ncbi:MAG: hypothetical protein QM496_13075 [Verrucomicrobiota bacterium]